MAPWTLEHRVFVFEISVGWKIIPDGWIPDIPENFTLNLTGI
jgi:hypothetical protein